VAVDWQEPVPLRRCAAYPLPSLTDIGTASAAGKHTTTPINYTRPSPRKHSPGGATPSEVADIQLLFPIPIYRPRKDERLSWPNWLTCNGWFADKWSPVSCRSSAGQGKLAGQRPTLYNCATGLPCQLRRCLLLSVVFKDGDT